MNMSDEFRTILARFLDIPEDHPIFLREMPPMTHPPSKPYVAVSAFKSIATTLKVTHDNTDTLTP